MSLRSIVNEYILNIIESLVKWIVGESVNISLWGNLVVGHAWRTHRDASPRAECDELTRCVGAIGVELTWRRFARGDNALRRKGEGGARLRRSVLVG